jgi:monoamine oxidase
MRLAQCAARGAGPAAELIQRWQADAPDRARRALLRGAAMAAAGAAAGCAPLARLPAQSDAEVVVVGAGMAGLVCAYRLQQAGVRVRVIEAQTRIGGRILSIRNHFADGQVAELGAELIDTGHTRMRELAAELGFVLDDFNEYRPELARALYWFDGARRSEREVIEAFTPIAALIERDLAVLGDAADGYRDPGNALALDRLSIDDWFDRNGVSGWVRKLLSVAYTTEMGLEPGEQSALNLLTFIDPKPDPFRIFGDSDERFHTRGGNDQLVHELARRLDGRIETATVLEALAQDGGAYTLSVRRDGASVELKASHVVLALPFTLLRKVRLDVELPPVKRKAIAELKYGTNAKLMIGFAQRTWTEGARSDGSTFTDLPLQTTWETIRQQTGSAGILTNFVGGRHGLEIGRGSAAEQAGLAVNDLDRVFPGIAAQRAGMKEARMHWPTNPWIEGSYFCARPGDWTTLGGAMAEPVGRLRFCGEHCSDENSGFMEGACETGQQTARELLAELGLAPLAMRGRRAMLGLRA